MKKILFFFTILFTTLVSAQVPQGISYQAIALNTSGNPVISSNIGLRLSVLDNTTSGTVLYSETHTKTTNAQGLFNTVIGQGTPITGTFSSINWGTNSKFLKVELDAAGGTNYTLVGTTQLLSVPYAMIAGSLTNTSNNNTTSAKNNNGKNLIAVFSDKEAKGYYLNESGFASTGNWSSSSVTFSNSIKGSIASNYSIVVYSDNEAKGYYLSSSGSANWSTSNASFINPIKGAISSNNIIVVYSNNEAKGYYLNPNSTAAGNWSSTNVTFSNPIKGAISSNNSIVVYSDYEAKGYYLNPNSTGTGNWSSTNVSFSSPIKGSLVSGNVIVIYSDNEAKGYYINPTGTTSSANWSSSTASFSSTIKGGTQSN